MTDTTLSLALGGFSRAADDWLNRQKPPTQTHPALNRPAAAAY